MVMKKISIPSRRWYENRERELNFPDRWEVIHLSSPGMDKPDLTPDEIRKKSKTPLTVPLSTIWPRGKTGGHCL